MERTRYIMHKTYCFLKEIMYNMPINTVIYLLHSKRIQTGHHRTESKMFTKGRGNRTHTEIKIKVSMS